MKKSIKPSKKKLKEKPSKANYLKMKPEELIARMEGLPKILGFGETGYSGVKPYKQIVDGFTPNALKNLIQIKRYRLTVSALTNEGLFYLSDKRFKKPKRIGNTSSFKAYFDPRECCLILVYRGVRFCKFLKLSRSSGEIIKERDLDLPLEFVHYSSDFLHSWLQGNPQFPKHKKELMFLFWENYSPFYPKKKINEKFGLQRAQVFKVTKEMFRSQMNLKIGEERFERYEEQKKIKKKKGITKNWSKYGYPHLKLEHFELDKTLDVLVFAFHSVLELKVINSRAKKVVKTFGYTIYDFMKNSRLYSLHVKGKDSLLRIPNFRKIIFFKKTRNLIVELHSPDNLILCKLEVDDLIKNKLCAKKFRNSPIGKFSKEVLEKPPNYYKNQDPQQRLIMKVNEERILAFSKKSISGGGAFNLIWVDPETLKETLVVEKSDRFFNQIVRPFGDDDPPLVCSLGKSKMFIMNHVSGIFFDYSSGKVKDGFLHNFGTWEREVKHFKDYQLYYWKTHEHLFFVRYEQLENGAQKFQAIENIYLGEFLEVHEPKKDREIFLNLDSGMLVCLCAPGFSGNDLLVVIIEPQTLKVLKSERLAQRNVSDAQAVQNQTNGYSSKKGLYLKKFK